MSHPPPSAVQNTDFQSVITAIHSVAHHIATAPRSQPDPSAPDSPLRRAKAQLAAAMQRLMESPSTQLKTREPYDLTREATVAIRAYSTTLEEMMSAVAEDPVTVEARWKLKEDVKRVGKALDSGFDFDEEGRVPGRGRSGNWTAVFDGLGGEGDGWAGLLGDEDEEAEDDDDEGDGWAEVIEDEDDNDGEDDDEEVVDAE